MVPWVSEEVNNTWVQRQYIIIIIVRLYISHAIDLDRDFFSLVDGVILQEKTNYANVELTFVYRNILFLKFKFYVSVYYLYVNESRTCALFQVIIILA